MILKKEFDSEPVYNKKFLKTKMKSYSDEATDFHDKEIPKAGCNHTCLAVITIDSALKKDDNYYLQVFLKEWKYTEKEKKVNCKLLTPLDYLYTRGYRKVFLLSTSYTVYQSLFVWFTKNFCSEEKEDRRIFRGKILTIP